MEFALFRKPDEQSKRFHFLFHNGGSGIDDRIFFQIFSDQLRGKRNGVLMEPEDQQRIFFCGKRFPTRATQLPNTGC